MIGRALGCVVVCGCLMAGASLQAHHSLAGVFDMKAEKEISGTLTKLQFVNPHGSMAITVKNPDGTTTDWVFTTGSATSLADRGISKVGPNALKMRRSGDREVHPGTEWESIGIPQVDYAGGRKRPEYVRG